MVYFTSDLHFGHGNIIKHCTRPFKDADEMDAVLIKNWQARVADGDTVYILGDMFFRSSYGHAAVLEQLKGTKHLIIGNHDKNWMNRVDLPRFFASVQQALKITHDGKKLFLCHCPVLEFNADYLVHGHIHNNRSDENWPKFKALENVLNAGVEINGYMPVTFEELAANNRLFRL
jgi:calcineurin-like phosphoesterase family protein